MCEYCGCQQIEAIAILTSEHERLRNLGHDLGAAARGADVDRARPIATAMRELLEPHTYVEERGLFPLLPQQFRVQLTDLVAEHGAIDSALSSVLEPTPRPHWPEVVAAGLAELFEHILKEQDGVFPAALAMLGPGDWDAVDIVRAAMNH